MRILFFHQGRIGDWAGAVLAGLKSQFPTAEVLVFDLHRLIKEKPRMLARNLAATGMDYGWDLIRGKRDLDDAFFTTSYLFHKVREISAEIHRKYPSDFSFQMHSMHDHSSPDRPHFVYTDFTYKSCLENSYYGQYKWVPSRSEWLIDLERDIYLRSACTFSQTESVARKLIESYEVESEKVLNVCYGPNIDSTLLRRIDNGKERYSLKTVLFIGNDWSRKGGPELVKAFDQVQEQVPGAKLLIVGCEPKLKSANIEIVGKVSLSELPKYYAEVSVFCMPSKLEPSAGVYVEAMHAGLPIVALDAKETREVVRDGKSGYLVRPDDVSGLAHRLVNLLSSPDQCAEMGRYGRQLASESYVWQKTFEKVGLRIRQCLGHGA